jgi:hypothetical protein
MEAGAETYSATLAVVRPVTSVTLQKKRPDKPLFLCGIGSRIG